MADTPMRPIDPRIMARLKRVFPGQPFDVSEICAKRYAHHLGLRVVLQVDGATRIIKWKYHLTDGGDDQIKDQAVRNIVERHLLQSFLKELLVQDTLEE